MLYLRIRALLHLVTNHSKKLFLLNSIIDKRDMEFFPLDNMRHLGLDILVLYWSAPGEELILWKLDVFEAY